MKQLRDYKKDVIYVNPNKMGIDIRIDHPDFEYFPELQDAVMAFLYDLSEMEQRKFLDKYNQPDLGWLHISRMSFKAWLDLAAEIENYITTGEIS